jgi:hypothetical protein
LFDLVVIENIYSVGELHYFVVLGQQYLDLLEYHFDNEQSQKICLE